MEMVDILLGQGNWCIFWFHIWLLES